MREIVRMRNKVSSRRGSAASNGCSALLQIDFPRFLDNQSVDPTTLAMLTSAQR